MKSKISVAVSDRLFINIYKLSSDVIADVYHYPTPPFALLPRALLSGFFSDNCSAEQNVLFSYYQYYVPL